MSLFSKKASFVTLKFRRPTKTKEEILDILEERPIKNIIGTPELGMIGYRGVNEENPFDYVNVKNLISFTEVHVEKKLPTKKLNKKVEEIRLQEYSHIKKKKFNDEYKNDIYDELALQESPSCPVSENKNEVIIDLDKNRAYISMKSDTRIYGTISRLENVFGLEKIVIESRFNRSNMKNVGLKALQELFCFWLYEKAKSNTFKDSLQMSTKLDMKDADTKVSISGDVVNFFDIYKRLKDRREITAVFLALPHELEDMPAKYDFALTSKSTGIKAFQTTEYSQPAYVQASTLIERMNSFNEMDQYVEALVHQFEKDVEGVPLDELFADIRGTKE